MLALFLFSFGTTLAALMAAGDAWQTETLVKAVIVAVVQAIALVGAEWKKETDGPGTITKVASLICLAHPLCKP